MSEITIRSIEYLRELSRLISDWEDDPACQCCDWAVSEIERLNNELEQLRLIYEKNN